MPVGWPFATFIRTPPPIGGGRGKGKRRAANKAARASKKRSRR